MFEILRALTLKERAWRTPLGPALCVLSMGVAIMIGDPGQPEGLLRVALVLLGLGLIWVYCAGCALTLSGLSGYTLKEPEHE